MPAASAGVKETGPPCPAKSSTCTADRRFGPNIL